MAGSGVTVARARVHSDAAGRRISLQTVSIRPVAVAAARPEAASNGSSLEMAAIAHALASESPGGFTAAQYRDRVGSGRQLAIQVLDYFDRRGVTVRRGDLRRAGKDPAQVFGGTTGPG